MGLSQHPVDPHDGLRAKNARRSGQRVGLRSVETHINVIEVLDLMLRLRNELRLTIGNGGDQLTLAKQLRVAQALTGLGCDIAAARIGTDARRVRDSSRLILCVLAKTQGNIG